MTHGDLSRCPGCDQSTELELGTRMVACPTCHTVRHSDTEGQIHVAAVEPLPPADDGALQLGARLLLQGVALEVIGQLRFDEPHGPGWDEWYLRAGDEHAAWLVQQGDELWREQPSRPFGPLPAPGASVAVLGERFTVAQRREGRCVGVAGQLRKVVLPGQTLQRALLPAGADEQLVAQQLERQGVEWTSWQRVEGARPAPAVSAEQDATGAEPGRCPGCSTPLPARAQAAPLTVCASCGCWSIPDGDQRQQVGQNPDDVDPRYAVRLGAGFLLEGTRLGVRGRQLLRAEDGTLCRRYLLARDDAEPQLVLWEERGHHLLLRPGGETDRLDAAALSPGSAAEVAGERFTIVAQGEATLLHGDGEQPADARPQQQLLLAQGVSGQHMLQVERCADGPSQLSTGAYLTPAAVWRGFGRRGKPAAPLGPHPAAPPSRRNRAAWNILLGGGALVLLELVLLFYCLTSGEELVLHQVSAAQYTAGTTLPEFQLPGAQRVTIRTTAPVHNAWLHVSLRLVDANGQTVDQGQVKLFQRRSGRKERHSLANAWHLGRVAAGRYRISLQAKGGRTYLPGSSGLQVPLTVHVVLGQRQPYLPAAALVLTVLAMVLGIALVQRRLKQGLRSMARGLVEDLKRWPHRD